MNDYRHLMVSLRGRSVAQKAASINEWVNRTIQWIPPDKEWNFNRWKSPQLTMEHGKGNCLDMAVLKLWLMLQCDVSEDIMGIGKLPGHAVMVFKYPHRKYCFSKPVIKDWILDNNPPFYYRKETANLTFNEPPIPWSEVVEFIKFDEPYWNAKEIS